MPKITKPETNTQKLLKKLIENVESEKRKNEILRNCLFRLLRLQRYYDYFCLVLFLFWIVELFW